MPTAERENAAPVACTLSATEMGPRLARIRVLTQQHLSEHELNGSSLRLRYAPGAAQEVAEVVELERECCAFLDFHLTHADGAVELFIVAPEQAVADAGWLFSQFLPAEPSPASACACSKG